MRINVMDVLSGFDSYNLTKLASAGKLADEYMQQGIPEEDCQSETARKFGRFMDSLKDEERQKIYAMVSAIVTAGKQST